MFKLIARLLPLLLLVLIHPDSAAAQQSNHPPELGLGDAVVSGFSGTLAPDPAKPRPANKSVVDLTFINPDGPAARIVGLAHPGHAFDASVFPAPKPFDVLAKDVGQVFGVALDDANPPNIYLAATSAFGLNLVGRGRNGQPERRKKGGPGVGWMKAQFGLDLQGGPGAIYKVDGRTGTVTLFANVTLDGVPNPAAGLGNLAYDAVHRQLFVSDLYTGMIHRFDLAGHDLGHYDHGIAARAAAKLAPVAFDPKHRPNIASERFDSEKPASWGFAPAARRVWALAAHDGRLYYSVAAGPQIWSVGIAADGSFANDPRWELDVPAQAGSLPVSDLAFSQAGAMILAQRATIAGAYDYSAFTQAGDPRVLRAWLKGPNDPPSPGRWKPALEEYAVGFAGEYRNTNGGVALGYGYDRSGALSTASCGDTLWTTGQHLRDNPALRSRLEPGGPLLVNGLQASPANLVRDANAPPALSYFIDYDGKFDDAHAAGHMGSVRILSKPCAATAVAANAAPPPPLGVVTPGGCVGPNCGNACTPTCVCPPGTMLRDGKCVPMPRRDVTCKPPLVPGPIPGSCVCPEGTVLVDGKCVPRPHDCKPPLVPGPHGTCVCPPGSVMQNGRCVPQICPPPLVPGPCACPPGTVQIDGRCMKPTPIDLGINKTGATTPVQEPFYSFTLTISNNGAGFNGTGIITVTDVLPPGMTFTNITVTGPWSCPTSVPAGGTMICTYTGSGPIGPGVIGTITIAATAGGKPPYPPIKNCATVGVVPGSGYIDSNAGNNQSCVVVTKPDGKLSVTKKVAPDPRGLGGSLIFPMTVTCTNPTASYPLNVHGNTSTVPFNLPVGSHCTVTETLPALPKGCSWLPASFSPANIIIAGGLNQEVVTNGYRCREVCPPPQVMNAAGICACPPPMVTGAVPGTCVCPQGTTLVNGKCVPVEVCLPPLVMIPGIGCRCPDGEVLIHGKCVKPIVCRPPLVANATNTDCVCPDGMVLRRGKCVTPAKPKHERTCKRGYVWNGDMCVRRKTQRQEHERREQPEIRIPLPGVFPHGGRPENPRGGRNDNPRGDRNDNPKGAR